MNVSVFSVSICNSISIHINALKKQERNNMAITSPTLNLSLFIENIKNIKLLNEKSVLGLESTA